MHIEIFPLGPLQTNGAIVYNAKEAVAIDMGGDPTPVLAWVQAKGLTVTHILCTHLHFDHTYGNKAMSEATGASIFASAKDAFLLEGQEGRGGVWGCPVVDEYTFQPLEPGPLALLGGTCRVLATPGHTPGGLSFYFPEIQSVVVGDTLFRRSIGRTDFAGGDLNVLMKSIIDELLALPDETKVYPGHSGATSIGEERLNNPFISEFIV